MTQTLIDYNGRSLLVEFTVSDGRPAVPYLKNGDPGYPEEPPEVEILNVWDAGGKIEEPADLAERFYDDFLEVVREEGKEARADAAEYQRDRARGEYD